MNREDAARAARGPIDRSLGEVDTGERQVRVSYVLRMDEEDDDLHRWLVDEATRRGLNPMLMKDLLREAHQGASSTEGGRTA